jgi:hypothetical protein
MNASYATSFVVWRHSRALEAGIQKPCPQGNWMPD